MLWILAALAVGTLTAYLIHDHYYYEVRACPDCGETEYVRVVAGGLPNLYCLACSRAEGPLFWLDDLVRHPDSDTSVLFNGEMRPFGPWTEFPGRWWCWAFHNHTHEGPAREDHDHGPSDLP